MSLNKFKHKIKSSNFITDYRWWVWLMLALIFFFGLVGRFYDFDDPPLDFHPTRQLHSLIIARGMYYEKLEDAPDWQRSLAVRFWKAEGNIEPPIMERLAVVGYQLVGNEDYRIPRALSILFWTLGGIGLFLLSTNLVGSKGAVIGLAYYMVLPYPLIASRSFQPDPLMTATIIWSWWGISNWVQKESWENAIIAGLLTGFALFIKSQAVFFVLPVIITAVLINRRLKEILADPKVWVMLILAALPFLIYNIHGLFLSGSLQGRHGLYTDLLKNPFHYLRWQDYIDRTLGIEFFLTGLFGVLLLRDKKFKIMYASIFLGYFLFGLVFAYHMISHDYYQIPLTPAIAIGLSAVAAVLIDNLKEYKLASLIVLSGLLFFWMSINFWDARMTLKHSSYHDVPALYEYLGGKTRDYAVVSITPDYGFLMSYWGWKQTTYWWSEGDFHAREMAGQEVDKEVMFTNAIDGMDLFLVTDFGELNRQPDVKTFLVNNYPVFDEGEGYLIYDLRIPYSLSE